MQLPCNAVGVNDANHARYCTRPRIDGWANRSDGRTGQTRDVLGASERLLIAIILIRRILFQSVSWLAAAPRRLLRCSVSGWTGGHYSDHRNSFCEVQRRASDPFRMIAMHALVCHVMRTAAKFATST